MRFSFWFEDSFTFAGDLGDFPPAALAVALAAGFLRVFLRGGFGLAASSLSNGALLALVFSGVVVSEADKLICIF